MKDTEHGARGRFGEIVVILTRHNVAKGLSPEKLRAILEDLGPTYVKLGQIASTRSDLIPDAYCHELSKLRSEVQPMPIEMVHAAIETAYGAPWDEAFAQVGETPLGAASIAQVHLATLNDGQEVVLKVQRPGIYETMRRDIALLKKAAGLAKFTPIGDTIDLDLMLDEMWRAAERELNFLEEAKNLKTFAENMRKINYVACPAVYDALVTEHILVLEYVKGIRIDDVAALKEAGYNPAEIAAKLAENFIKQVVDDRFFHADPHPGNIRVRDGKIVWLDMGMMGHLTDADGAMFSRYIEAVALNDVEKVTDTVLAMGMYEETPDRALLLSDIEALLARYRQMSLSSIDAGRVLQEFLALARKHGIAMPPNMTMLARSVVILESVLTTLDPETNLLQIISAHVKRDKLSPAHIRALIENHMRQFSRSADKLGAIPGQLSDALQKLVSGHATITINVAGAEAESRARDTRNRRLTRAVVAAALLISGAIASLSNLPGPGGLPWPSAALFSGALVALLALFIKRRR